MEINLNKHILNELRVNAMKYGLDTIHNNINKNVLLNSWEDIRTDPTNNICSDIFRQIDLQLNVLHILYINKREEIK